MQEQRVFRHENKYFISNGDALVLSARLPLMMQRKTRGVLCLAKETPLDISEATRDFVLMASEHLALFLENLYVKCRLRDVCAAAAQREETLQRAALDET